MWRCYTCTRKGCDETPEICPECSSERDERHGPHSNPRAVVELDERDRIRYRVIDGPEAGIRFLASDRPHWLIGETVTVTYHPDDQYARRV